MKNQLSEISIVTKKTIKILICFSSIFSILSIVFLINLFKNSNLLKGPAMIFTIPIYLMVKLIKLNKDIQHNIHINLIRETIKFCFVIYIIFLIGKIVFPIYIYNNYNLNFKLNTSFIQFKSIINSVYSIENYSLTINDIVLFYLKRFILFVPLGFFISILYNRFKKFKNCILLGLGVYLIMLLAKIFLALLGICHFQILNIDYLLIYICSLILGYYIYNKYNYKLIKCTL